MKHMDTMNTMGYIVFMVITWDEQKGESNLVKHGISFQEAQTVLFAPASVTIDDKDHTEERFVTIAFSQKLNLLVVVYAYRFEDEIRIISARKATKKERKFYEERI
jgi:uncharacterized DUF497 family protein